MKNEIIFVSILTVSILVQFFLAFGIKVAPIKTLRAGALNSMSIYICVLLLFFKIVEVQTIAMALAIQVSMEIILFSRLKNLIKSGRLNK
jgi:hypothetical protein